MRALQSIPPAKTRLPVGLVIVSGSGSKAPRREAVHMAKPKIRTERTPILLLAGPRRVTTPPDVPVTTNAHHSTDSATARNGTVAARIGVATQWIPHSVAAIAESLAAPLRGWTGERRM